MDFDARDMADRIRLGKVACVLVIVLMPAGCLLDVWLYPDEALIFLAARLVCSVLVGGLLALHYTELGREWIRPASWLIALLPALFISGMIAVNEGANSPYYAGLNLILLATNVVVHWNLRESLLTSALIIALYITAITFNGSPPEPGQPYAYLFFMIETAVIVITGNYFYNRLRLREFEAQHDLQLSQQNLEHSNKRLLELDELKGRFFANISHELRTPLTLVLAPSRICASTRKCSATRPSGIASKPCMPTACGCSSSSTTSSIWSGSMRVRCDSIVRRSMSNRSSTERSMPCASSPRIAGCGWP